MAPSFTIDNLVYKVKDRVYIFCLHNNQKHNVIESKM